MAAESRRLAAEATTNASPGWMAWTTPTLLTVATAGFELDHDTDRGGRLLDMRTTADSSRLSPTRSVSTRGVTVTETTPKVASGEVTGSHAAYRARPRPAAARRVRVEIVKRIKPSRPTTPSKYPVELAGACDFRHAAAGYTAFRVAP